MSTLSRLSDDLRKLTLSSNQADVKFILGKDEVVRHGHSLILCTRSTYFERALSPSWSEAAEGVYRKPNVEPEVFDIILDYLYTGHCDLAMETLPLVTAAAFEMEMKELKMCCEDYACKHLADDNACCLFDLAVRNDMPLLLKASVGFIQLRATEIFNTPGFVGLGQDLFSKIVSSNILNSTELQVWRATVRWTLHQCDQDWRHSRLLQEIEPSGRLLVAIESNKEDSLGKKNEAANHPNLSASAGDRVVIMSSSLHAQLCKTIAPLLRYVRFTQIPASDFFRYIEGTGLVPSDTCFKVYRHHAVPTCYPASEFHTKARISISLNDSTKLSRGYCG